MTYTEKKTYAVTLKGYVVIKADTSSEAIEKAANYFITAGKGLDWSAQEMIIVEPEPAP